MQRVAIITGGARGIGRAVGLSLAADGWNVAFCYRTSETDAAQTASAIERAGASALAERCDVSRPAECEAFVEKTLSRWGRADALINGAGPYTRVPLLDSSLEQWHEMFDNNLHPVFYMSRLVAPSMKENRWGRIVSFSMANADQTIAQPQLTAHYIAKVSILVLTRTLAKVLAPHNVTANVISPGFIASGSAPDDELAKMVKMIPAGYVGELPDAVSAVRFLLSEEARYVNGGNIHLSGGWGI
ncbi:MAG: SDR family oxidoreductase [Acidobacteriota bacterium]